MFAARERRLAGAGVGHEKLRERVLVLGGRGGKKRNTRTLRGDIVFSASKKWGRGGKDGAINCKPGGGV